MRTVLNWCFRHLFAYREQVQKWILGSMFFGVITLPACPVCFCDELGWPDHITVTYGASSADSKTVEILCTPLKETRCGAWHDDNKCSREQENSTQNIKHATQEEAQ